MSDSAFSLDALYAAIEDHIRQALPSVRFVATCPDIQDRIALPAVFLEPVEFEPGPDIGTGETVLVQRFEARVIVAPELARHQQLGAQLAAQIAVLLRAQTWGLDNVEQAQFVASRQDWTKPELDGYTVWTVEWTQQIYLGEVEWLWPVEPPGTLYLNVDGCTGTGNEDHYFQPEDLAWDTPAPNMTG
ncbi:hypothetical protein [Pseudomonas azerbaijanorientalis]|uniref:hypothetical protein n=1 Tax=Pseudomonas azerbaijanorientalis TaxID=2842350 RepID=UPI001C3C42A7|nr:hypothetical protein [Pseudomonas azerbaijanorientalis]QXH63813.1 hypothetical protein KSS91_10140 [Pseudomonas azerbaijanorientalis]